MFELDKMYSTKELAKEMGISYESLRTHREKYEKYLSLFFEFETKRGGRGNGVHYILTFQSDEYIPYKEYYNEKKKNAFKRAIVETIEKDNRQSGSNIGSIISEHTDIEVYDLSLDTVIVYTRTNLKELEEDGFYTKVDPRWCRRDKYTNKYYLLSDEQVAELRELFKICYKEMAEVDDHIWSQYKEKRISRKKASELLGELKLNSYAAGCAKFADKYGYYPSLISAYKRNAFYNGKFKNLNQLAESINNN